jgi:outer membrane protein OmpA-like peptidoglycan-associated protein
MKKLGIALSVALGLAPLLSWGQSGRVLKNHEVNEAALIDALTPESKPLTRSIRVTPDRPSVNSPVKTASASMLITFETNSAELTEPSKQILDKLGRALQSDKLAEFKFSIEGHADPRGGEQLNQQLSQQRAERVVSYLAENMNIDRVRLKAVGKGQSELLNTANPGAPENRRVTVKTVVE